MNVVRQGYSQDGYIIDQARLKDVPYGRRTSDYNGCGWIAAYNFLRCMGERTSVENVLSALSKRMFLGGLVGTNPLRLRRYLKKQGYPLHLALGKKNTIRAGDGAQAGVVLYRHCNGWHFVTFTRENAGSELRFLNASPGNERDIMPMATFLAQRNLAPVVAAFFIPIKNEATGD